MDEENEVQEPEAEVSDDLGFEEEAGEFDDTPADTEDEPEAEAPAEVAEAEPEPVSAYVPEAGEDADDAALRDLMTPEAYASMRRVMAREMRQQMQAMTAANIHVTTAAAQNPELFRIHGARIQHNLAQLDPSLRAKPEAVAIAVAGLFLEEAKTKGIGPALAKLSGMASPAKPAVKAPKAPIPAAQRPPSPASSRGTAQPNVQERRLNALMEYGLSKSEALQALTDEGVLR